MTGEFTGFVDSAEWEQIERKSEAAIKRWINNQLNGTSVTVVLIGSETYGRKWIDYEIEESGNRGNGLVGVYIHNIKNRHGYADSKGKNPLSKWHFESTGEQVTDVYNTYDWKYDDGYNNFGHWVEEAARIADRR